MASFAADQRIMDWRRVTERKGYPVKDVAAAGGWRDEQTMLKSYQHADAETVRQVVLHPTQRLVSR